jgi:NAD(P)-dependent dehydrogenase (short-subunit alcohol dehydrogenase family)
MPEPITQSAEDPDEFRGKVAFVTGGAMGMGSAFAQALCERGASVAIADINEAGAAGVADALKAAGGKALGLACNVADEAAVASATARTAEAFGGIDILINNAGLHSAKYNVPFETLGHAEIRRLIDVNIMGVVNCSLACRPLMAARGGGVIFNLASIAGYSINSPYGVSKLAVRGLTIAFAREFAEHRIRVNAIAPGLIATDVVRAELPAQLFEDFAQKNQLVRRTGEIADAVQAMLFLCSSRASFITGETLKVSGGFPLAI